MTVIFCDDVYCKIEIVPNMVMAGTFWVVLDGDDETAECAMRAGGLRPPWIRFGIEMLAFLT